MNKKITFNTLLTLLVLGLATITIQSVPETQALLNSPLPTPRLFDSPLPTPVPSPSPTPAPSAAAQKALAYLSQRERLAPENLVIVNEFRREAPLLGQIFQAVTVLDTESGRFFQVLVDLDSEQVEDRASIEEAEERRHRAKYGKLQPALYERLLAMSEDETVTVTIWVVAPPERSLAEQQAAAFATLAARYPQAREAMEQSGKPMDVDDPALAERIYDEYVQILNAEAASRIRPLVKALEAQGFAIRIAEGLPAVTVTLPKRVVQALAWRDDVGAIRLAEGEFRLGLNWAIPTNMAPVVWARGYDGTGVDIAILETDNVDFTSPAGSECPGGNNCFRHQGPTRVGSSGVDWHATLVASAAASDHGIYRGMAPGATIMSAGMQGPGQQDGVDALVWALNEGAQVVNLSGGWCTASTQMEAVDRAFDHYARSRFRLLVAIAHNNTNCGNDIVASPAKGWNVLSVGAYNDHNDSNWSNDGMANFSCWNNPHSPHGDHEKPEVVAPGVEIVGIGLNGNLVTDPDLNTGTSFAAPQVTGLAGLLIHRNWSLNTWPEASRAIIMASATHNIDGPTGIPSGQDLRDGAGGINAALADTVAQTHNFSDIDPCADSCWWGIGIYNTSFPVGTYLYRYFTANKGDFVRVAIAWWSNADCSTINNCNFDRLDTDLHLGVLGPDGQWVPGAWSASWDNNYELVEFVAPKTGTYWIAVYKERADEPSNYLGIALVRLHRVYIPLVLKNFP
jgi:subtilisin family serine protease